MLNRLNRGSGEQYHVPLRGTRTRTVSYFPTTGEPEGLRSRPGSRPGVGARSRSSPALANSDAGTHPSGPMRPSRRPAAQGLHSYPATQEANALAKVGARGGVARAASGPTGVVGPPVRMCSTGAAGGAGVDSVRTRFAGAGAVRGATAAAAARVVAFSDTSFMGVICRRPRAGHIRARARRGACSGHGAARSPSTGFERPPRNREARVQGGATGPGRPRRAAGARRALRKSREAARGRGEILGSLWRGAGVFWERIYGSTTWRRPLARLCSVRAGHREGKVAGGQHFIWGRGRGAQQINLSSKLCLRVERTTD